jgi:CheY-like chemotaxis protein
MENKKLEILVVEDRSDARGSLIAHLLERFCPESEEYKIFKSKKNELKEKVGEYFIEILGKDPYHIENDKIRIDSFAYYDQALEAMKKYHYDGIITDIGLPSKEKIYFDTEKLLQEIDPNNANLFWEKLKNTNKKSFIQEAIFGNALEYPQLTVPSKEEYKKILENINTLYVEVFGEAPYGNLIAKEALKRNIPVVMWTGGLYHANAGITLGIGQGLFDSEEIADAVIKYDRSELILAIVFIKGKVPLVTGAKYIYGRDDAFNLGAKAAVDF